MPQPLVDPPRPAQAGGAPTPLALQDSLTEYFDAEFCHSAGDYATARDLVAHARPPEGFPASRDSVLLSAFRQISETASHLNHQLLTNRNASRLANRHPGPEPAVLAIGAIHECDLVYDFYSAASEALRADPLVRGTRPSLLTLREAILLTVDDDTVADTAARLDGRYKQRKAFAQRALRTSRTGTASGHTIDAFADAGLDASVAIPAFVLRAFVQAHVDRYNVEHRRSVSIGQVLARTRELDLRVDRELLEQALALLTYTFSVCRAMPWLFSAGVDERLAIQAAPRTARDRITPSKPLWLARKVLLLSVYRRAHVFRLLGEHERSYNDLRKVQRICRLTRLGLNDGDPRGPSLNSLVALAEFRIGELYRADHDAAQALVHLCRGHDLVTDLREEAGAVNESALFQLQIRLSKGKAFLEVGAVTRALKWFVRAWLSLRALDGTDAPDASVDDTANGPRGEELRPVEKLDGHLDRVKWGPELDKEALNARLEPAVTAICEAPIGDSSRALAADILTRIAHVLLVLRLSAAGRSRHAERLLERAAELDPHNLLVWSGLLRCELRGMPRFGSHAPNPMACWPSGATDVDQAIRLGEYLMLERLRDAECGSGATRSRRPEVKVARALLYHFHTHTDSINLRLGILHRYLMQPRSTDGQTDASPQRDERSPSQPGMDFVCLRRYGSFTPFMPRPAAVSAVGGGYLVRVFPPGTSQKSSAPSERVFNILVDPGDGVINNLYRVGLAISDVDMIVATHDHPDHLAALDAILSLRHERRDRLRRIGGETATAAPDGSGRFLILGNRSVVSRYGHLNGTEEYVVQHIADATVQACPQLSTRGLEITALPTAHEDLGRDKAVGFILEFDPTRRGRRRSDSSTTSRLTDRSVRITFMSDTPIQGLGKYSRRRLTDIHDVWLKAFKSDLVIAHVSDAPSGELRDLAHFLPSGHARHVDEFDKAVAALLDDRSDEAMQLMHALSLIDHRKKPTPSIPLLKPGFVETMETWSHLYLHGLLEVARAMKSGHEGRQQILVVGELREQLGSFRGTIARELNCHVFDRSTSRASLRPDTSRGEPDVVALTADIGLRIRLSKSRDHRVRCSTCALNNDRLVDEQYHRPHAIREVCVKGDHEAMYWNCDRHDPSHRTPAVFVEQMGSYDPFATSRFHG